MKEGQGEAAAWVGGSSTVGAGASRWRTNHLGGEFDRLFGAATPMAQEVQIFLTSSTLLPWPPSLQISFPSARRRCPSPVRWAPTSRSPPPSHTRRCCRCLPLPARRRSSCGQLERYSETKGHYPDRTLRSIQTRWEKIKQESRKFAGFVADALRAHASGKSDADKTTEAAATFAAVEGHNFQFMYCWDLLKDVPKWQDLNQKGARDADVDGFGDHIPPGSNTINVDVNDPSPDASRKRPIGRDVAKASRKKINSSGSTSSSEYASRMQEMSLQKISIWQDENTKKGDRFDQLTTIEEKRYDEQREHNKSILQLEQEQLKIMHDKLEMQMREKEREREEREKAEDERILKIDLDSCTPELRMYYQALREEIMEKVAARRTRN